MMRVEIFIPGRNRAKDRPRASVGKNGKPFMWTPKKTVQMEAMIREEGLEALRLLGLEEPWRGPVKLLVINYFQRPKNWWAGKEPMGGYGDYDNLAKTVCDGLNKTIFCDDAQITDGRSIKRYANTPGVKIILILKPLVEKPRRRLTKKTV